MALITLYTRIVELCGDAYAVYLVWQIHVVLVLVQYSCDSAAGESAWAAAAYTAVAKFGSGVGGAYSYSIVREWCSFAGRS